MMGLDRRARHLTATTGMIALSAVLAAGFASPAVGQTTSGQPQDIGGKNTPPDVASGAITAAPDQSDIVVTGTLVRGIAPVGTNVLSITSESIARSGAVDAQQLLAQVPQVSNFFNQLPRPSGDVTFPASTPDIRNLPGINSTLSLLNGRRLVNLGIIQAAGDPGVIPVAAIDRVEVVPDGGSATYGSDAVGGTINFIPKRKFDGVQIDGTYGLAADYRQRYISALVGKSWGSGSIYAAYSYLNNDPLFNGDRAYTSQYQPDKGGGDYRSSNCAAPNVTANGTVYALPGFTPGTNRCDTSAPGTLFPAQKRNSVFVYMTQDLSPGVQFENQIYYSSFIAYSYKSQIASTEGIDSTNPFFHSIGGETSQTVQYGYDPVWGPNRYARTFTSEWGISPKFTFTLPGDFKLDVSGNYGRGFARVTEQTYNPTLESAAALGTTTATALDPYDIAMTNPAVLNAIHDYENYATSLTEIEEARAVVNGSLLTLPGGSVRIAVGGEFRHEYQAVRNIQDTYENVHSAPLFVGQRSIKSGFGELVIPIFGNDNGFAGMRRLTVSAAGRYDSYSDAGNTFNPKVGATWVPFDSLTIRGNYGTSFSAPQLGDTSAAADTRAQVFTNSFNLAPNASPAEAQRRTILIAGGNLGLKPQTAKTYSVGADFKPTFLPGLTISATYYSVLFKNLISITPVFDSSIFTPAFSKYITINPTLAQAQQLLAGFRLDGISSIDALYANGQSPYLIADARRYNLGIQRTQGIDYNFAYDRKTNFGSINLSVGGSYTLVRESQPFANGATTDAFAVGAPRLSLVGTAGASYGPVTAQIQYFRTDGYNQPGNLVQPRVGAFHPTNLFISYDFKAAGALHGTQVSLTVQNIFDEDPPFYNGGNGYANGSTIGRLFLIGLHKKF